MKKFLLFLSLCGAAYGAFANETSPQIRLTKAKQLASSARFKPRGAKLLRSVSAPAGMSGSLVSLLFYGKKPRSSAKKPFDVADNALLVDLQVLSQKKMGKKWRAQLLRTIPLGFCEDWNYGDAALLWLNPSKKTGPILRIPRPEADELITFPEGWAQKKAVRQVFSRSASSIEAISYQFDQVDEKGILKVTEVLSERKEGGSDESSTFLRWDGSGWKE